MSKPSVSSLSWGILLIVVGGVWLLSNLFDVNIDFGIFWPVFLLIPAALLWGSYLFGGSKADVNVLIPANILLFLGITFLFNMIASVYLNYGDAWILTIAMYSTGPVAIAFWITWAASGRKKDYLVPAVVLTIVSSCIAATTVPLALFRTSIFQQLAQLAFPLMLILLGFLIVTGPFWSRRFEQQSPKAPKSPESAKPSKSAEDKPLPAEADVEEGEIVEAQEIKPKEEEI